MVNEVNPDRYELADQFTPGNISYGVVHLIVWSVLLVILPVFVLPELRQMFEEFEIDLPALSQFFIAWSGRTVMLWFVWVPIVFLIATGSGIALLLMRMSRFRTALKFANIGLMLLVGLLFLVAIGVPLMQITKGVGTFSF